MMRSLFNKINWNEVSYVGFDMDGTLYDEYKFIAQAYKEISKLLKRDSLSFMKNRWLDMGSSYPYIFSEAYDLYNINLDKQTFINKALNIFRNFEPKIKLDNRVTNILKYFKNNYEIFLITDGNPVLQKKKFKNLGLDKFFNEKNVIFTGVDSKSFSKPNLGSLKVLSIEVEKSVFFGDRDVDKQFAINAKMQFQKVKVMNIV